MAKRLIVLFHQFTTRVLTAVVEIHFFLVCVATGDPSCASILKKGLSLRTVGNMIALIGIGIHSRKLHFHCHIGLYRVKYYGPI